MKRFLVGIATVGALACPGACDSDPESHVYVATLYDSVDDCFGPSTSLGYVQTPDGDLDCAPTCLAVTPATGSVTQIYVSTMCGPYPATYDTSQTNAGCPAALAAWPAEQSALADGTNSCASPPTTEDAGDDAAAEGDAAGTDSGVPDDASDAG